MTDQPPPVGCCTCGKTAWLTKQQADAIVVRAKIARYLHHNRKRREQRSYRCPTGSGLWHITSTADRTRR